ncbi:cytochrome b/b6 domain-containing protein [Cupriavidus plantarum]|uniref:cytochrome b/b6 domain-containing protein n=1 Tax=Cupriavidus plantarum TaxID=942865 RepID=UPI0015C770DF|nr:cytochrome b/b6 domain-containing protein [Cupriavidus plantarum]NYI01697.1 thiosulfate reductase cytochrome b subunit [Cupriavidus plantarum]
MDSSSNHRFVARHAVVVRLTHWANVVCLSILLMSGLQIFNAHPRLYWGKYGADTDHAFIAASAFPSWLTIPSYQDLGAGRHWHFLFAWLLVINGLVYLAYGLWRGHIRRDLVPDADQLTPRHLWHEVRDHARLRFPKGEAARRYNALQKIAYLAVAFGLIPLMVLTGLTMSPGLDAAFPFLPDLFGGRPSARTLHFLTASSLVLFVVVHVAMVVLSGFWNNMRSMLTGRYAIEYTEGDR